MPQQFRLAARLAGAIVYALLPLSTPEQLNTTALVSIGAAISAFVVIWETIGGLECGARPFESWSRPTIVDQNVPVLGGKEVKLPPKKA